MPNTITKITCTRCQGTKFKLIVEHEKISGLACCKCGAYHAEVLGKINNVMLEVK